MSSISFLFFARWLDSLPLVCSLIWFPVPYLVTCSSTVISFLFGKCLVTLVLYLASCFLFLHLNIWKVIAVIGLAVLLHHWWVPYNNNKYIYTYTFFIESLDNLHSLSWGVISFLDALSFPLSFLIHVSSPIHTLSSWNPINGLQDFQLLSCNEN